MNSPLWLLGIACAPPCVSMDVGVVVGGAAGVLLASPVWLGASLPLAAQSAGVRSAGAMSASPAWGGDGGERGATPPTTGAVYG